jgi:hypothetical protein
VRERGGEKWRVRTYMCVIERKREIVTERERERERVRVRERASVRIVSRWEGGKVSE